MRLFVCLLNCFFVSLFVAVLWTGNDLFFKTSCKTSHTCTESNWKIVYKKITQIDSDVPFRFHNIGTTIDGMCRVVTITYVTVMSILAGLKPDYPITREREN